MDAFIPVVATLGLGGFLGWAAATFLKTTARFVGCIVGLIFILVQYMSFKGWIHLDWSAISHATAPLGTAAKHGGGTLWRVLTYNLPFTGGFAGGFWYGMKR
jgi:uncharacterized membrane protein (Fun14 family)